MALSHKPNRHTLPATDSDNHNNNVLTLLISMRHFDFIETLQPCEQKWGVKEEKVEEEQ